MKFCYINMKTIAASCKGKQKMRYTRRDFLKGAGIGLVSLAASSCAVFNMSRPRKKPNILFILADDLGYGDVACYNPDSKIPTPNLDKFASEGMRFTDAHSPSTVCTPTRYSILTGRMEFRTGMRGVFTGVGRPCLIDEDRLTLPQMLRDKGYATACFGKEAVEQYFGPGV